MLCFQVLFGGGRLNFLPTTASDPMFGAERGNRVDGRNLIDDWMSVKGKRGRSQRRYVYRKDQFDALQPGSTDSVLGQFQHRGGRVEWWVSVHLPSIGP